MSLELTGATLHRNDMDAGAALLRTARTCGDEYFRRALLNTDGMVMLKNFIRSVFFLSLAVSLISCGSNPNKHADIQPSAAQKKFKFAYISNLSVTLIDDAPDERRLNDKKSFEDKIPALVRKELQNGGLTILADNPGTRESLIAINVKVKYDPGNRALRWVAGMFGAGKGTIEAYLEGVDQATGNVIASTTEYNSKRMGAAGGNFYDMAEDTVEEATEDLAEKLSKL